MSARLQFSLGDIFAATVMLIFPTAWIAAMDLEDIYEPERLGVALGMGLLLGFPAALKYRQTWNSRSPWFVPPFLLFFWSVFFLPFSLHQNLWPTTAYLFYPPVFLCVAVGFYFNKKGRKYPILGGVFGFFVGFLFAGVFQPPLVTPRSLVNEWAASSTAKSLAEAQEIYHRTDYDKDGVLEFAPTPRELFETRPGAADLQFIDAALANADTTQPNPNAQMKAGYLIRALHGQGPQQTNGARSYVDASGNHTQGFAFVLYPAIYKRMGRRTFVIDRNGTIYSKDLGRDTRKIAEAMTVFDPDPTWEHSE